MTLALGAPVGRGQPGPDPAASAPAVEPAGRAARPASPAAAVRPSVLVARPVFEWSAAAAAGALWLTTGALVKPRIAPTECRWCDANWFDDQVRSLRWSDPHPADLASDVISYAVAPVVIGGLVALAAAHDGRAREISVDELMVAEATVAAGLIGEASRLGTARERPSVHALPDDQKPAGDAAEENNLSFFSGHVATSFALAVSSGTVATMRRRRLAPLVWASGLTMAVTTSYLRIASDEHYATDVLAGVVAGVGLGLAVPLLHRRAERVGSRVIATAAPLPGGAMVLLLWR